MQITPRLALGTIEAGVDIQPLLWALCDVLERSALHVQTFSAQARFAAHDATAVITGQRRRHLDSWLMPADVSRELFHHGVRDCDIAVVEGEYDAARLTPEIGGSLDALCDWLNLPRLVVLDAERLRRGFSLRRPESVDGVLIDKAADHAEARRFQTTIEALWGVPVLGSLPLAPNLRAALGGLQRGCPPSRELCQALGVHLSSHLHFQRLCDLASSRHSPPGSSRMFAEEAADRPLNVAVAIDDVFQCYFPDTLDLLEARGAVLRDFSPLSDERLPHRTDVVYFGCGLPELHAHALSSNHCMQQSIRAFARAGGRIFAECGGLAYLSEQIEMLDGRCIPMTGLLPVTARVNPAPEIPQPVEVTLGEDTWLGEEGTRLRGYQNTNYRLEPAGELPSLAREPAHHSDLLGDGRVLASRIHLNFAAHTDLLGRFFHPHKLRTAVG